jgi:hypothetical protein
MTAISAKLVEITVLEGVAAPPDVGGGVAPWSASGSRVTPVGQYWPVVVVESVTEQPVKVLDFVVSHVVLSHETQ